MPQEYLPSVRMQKMAESHPAVCKRLPAPTCKNKLGNWDQLPSLHVSKPRWCLSPALQGFSWPKLPAPLKAQLFLQGKSCREPRLC